MAQHNEIETMSETALIAGMTGQADACPVKALPGKGCEVHGLIAGIIRNHHQNP